MPVTPLRPSAFPTEPTVRPPRTLPSRAFARVEALSVKSDDALKTASLRLELPLSSIAPALAPDELAGLSVRIAAPAGSQTVAPLELVEKNGQRTLVISAEGLDVSSLAAAPLVLALGEPQLLFDPKHPAVSSPFVRIQVSYSRVQLDVRSSVERGLRERVAELTQSIERVEQERRATAAGTSTWFGHRQLESDLGAAQGRLEAAVTALAPLAAQATAAWETTSPMNRALTAPVDEAVRVRWRSTLVDAKNAELELPRRRELAAAAHDVPELAAADRASLEALEAAVDAGRAVEAEVRRVFADLPEAAKRRWLRETAALSSPTLGASFAEALTTARDAEAEVANVSGELAALRATSNANLAPRLASLDERIDRLRAELEATAARLSDLGAEPTPLQEVPARFSPDTEVI